MLDKEFQKESKRIIDRALSISNWACLCKWCENKTINSHLLQRHGVLDNITENGHMYEVKPKNIFNPSNNRMQFQKVGINNALSWPIYCNKHDTELYKPIECKILDCSNYKNQLLFSLRSTCAELRKKEIRVEILRNMINEFILPPEEHHNIQVYIYGLDKGISDFRYYKNLIENELETTYHKFHFYNYTYPKIDIYSSSTFSYIEYYDYAQKVRSEKPWEAVFFHVIPQAESIQIIIGYHEDHCNDSIRKLTQEFGFLNCFTLGQKLTDLFAFHIEGWGLSPSLYKLIPEVKKQEYLKSFDDNIYYHEASL
ncbi:hypothetical protein [Phocaeicola paurosaccharolyticus]|uniref:hypothetical protein n=1 Tax=Phocaeicola paurosaccharolyticus TaxID=732242 RepID=UPI0004695349|nr:hypothetical protein [Phocaeicola paurosaccharolyticus]